MSSESSSNARFEAEVEELRSNGVVGQSGRLRELFDFFAERGPVAEPATQAEIAKSVFGQSETDADDATVRVYVHRLRKKLEDHYRANPPSDARPTLEIPAGVYALQLVEPEAAVLDVVAPVGRRPSPSRYWSVVALAALVAAFLAGIVISRAGTGSGNAIWDPLVESERPVLIVLGDYYLFGEINPVRPEEGRLIRDFRVNSPEDLLLMQEAEPETFAYAEDVGLNYLPFQTAYALHALAPIFEEANRPVQIIAASELTSEMLVENDVVYLGLLSGMGLLEEITFAGSGLRIGESYDELLDRESGQRWASDEARRLASPAFYRDFAYIARYRAPGDALVTIIASERVTGLRGIGAIVAEADLSEELEKAAREDSFEALFQITGQQGADLNERLILARPRE